MVKKIVLLLAGALILIALIAWLVIALARAAKGGGPSPYSAVYLSTGDVYFGELSWFPRPRLRGVWLLQRTINQDNEAQFSIARFTDAFWGPMDEVYLNPQEIVFWTRLSRMSKAVEAFMAEKNRPSASPAAPSGAPRDERQ